MNEPALTFYAPRKDRSGNWILRADIAIGRDTLSVTAKLSPQTAQWARAAARKGALKTRGYLRELARTGGKYVRLKGDWSPLGVLGETAARVASWIAGHPTLQSYEDARAAAELYKCYLGEKGTAAQQRAHGYVGRIENGAAAGDLQAIEAKGELSFLQRADEILHMPDAYQRLGLLLHDSEQGDPQAKRLLQAVKALGDQGQSGDPVSISYDLAEYMVAPDRLGRVTRYASDCFAMRGLCWGRRRLTVPQCYHALCEIANMGRVQFPAAYTDFAGFHEPYNDAGFGGFYRPLPTPQDRHGGSCCGSCARGGACESACPANPSLERSPTGGYDSDLPGNGPMGSCGEGACGWEDPDQTDMRDGLWGGADNMEGPTIYG